MNSIKFDCIIFQNFVFRMSEREDILKERAEFLKSMEPSKVDLFLSRTFSNTKCYPMTFELGTDSEMWTNICVRLRTIFETLNLAFSC